ALGWRVLRDGGESTPPATSGGFRARLGQFASGIREVASDRRVVAVSAMEGVQNMSMGALEAFLPVYAVTVAGLAPLQAGLLWAVQVVTTLLAKPLLGRASDARGMLGRRGLIVAGVAACAVPFAAVPHLTGFWPLAGACLVFGFGEALVTSSSAALVADLCRARHYGTAMGVFGTIFDVGHASGPLLGGLLVGALGYGPAFAIIAGVLLCSVPWFLAVMRGCDYGTLCGQE
ncbi:MFS transporter, partial [Nitratidesulfovibrio liaohensis]|uniref:MFS transporter n=1 Tax=Nitratidesulfovibrio liaohensis TaxID=2604158 RepID=UPI00142205F1